MSLMLPLALAFEFQKPVKSFQLQASRHFFSRQTIFYTFLFPLYFTIFLFCSPKKIFSLPLHSIMPHHLPFFFFILPFTSCSFGFHLLFLFLCFLLAYHHSSFLFLLLFFLFSLSSFGQLSHFFSFFFLLSFSWSAFAPLISSGNRSVSYVESTLCDGGVWRAVLTASGWWRNDLLG